MLNVYVLEFWGEIVVIHLKKRKKIHEHQNPGAYVESVIETLGCWIGCVQGALVCGQNESDAHHARA